MDSALDSVADAGIELGAVQARPDRIVLHRIAMPLRAPFRTAHGLEVAKQTTLVEVEIGGIRGWGECAALAAPEYTEEYADGAFEVLDRFLAPAALAHGVDGLSGTVGNRMAKAAIEVAVVDASLRASGQALGSAIGATRTRVRAGVVVGVSAETGIRAVDETNATVEARVAEGYQRVKLKLRGSDDLALVEAVRSAFRDLELAVDFNGSLGELRPKDHQRLDDLGLVFVEQPVDAARSAVFAASIATPVCLDEPLVSLCAVQQFVGSGACSVVNLKPSRVGGLREALRIVEWCAANGTKVWIGGMLETGVGRAVNIALAGLAAVTITGDLSATNRFFDHDVCEPFELDEGHLAVPTGPGIGVEVDTEALDRFTVRRVEHRAEQRR